MTDPLQRASIVLVDDEPANLRLLERFLARAGFERVRAYGDGRSALTGMEAEPADLVLLDLHMPGMDGFELLRAIGQRLEADDFLPLVVLTGDTERASRSMALSGGASDYLLKPLDELEVVLRVRNHLRTRLLHEQVRQRTISLAAEVDSTARALHDLADEWTAVARTLTRLTARGSAEATAAAICAELATLPDVGASALLAFGAGGSAVPLALGALADGPLAVNVPLPDVWSRALRARAAGGAWIQAWNEAPWVDAGVAPRPSTSPTAVGMTVACVPMRDGPGLLGLLVVGVTQPDGAARLARRLPALEAVASLAAALLARDITDRQRDDAVFGAIDRAIHDRAFHPVFQPIVSLASGSIVGYEALTRFEDGTPPDRRFADATAVGLGPALEAATLTAAVAGAGSMAPEVFVSLNVSPAMVLAGDRLPVLLAGSRAPVVLEITEHVPIEDYGRLRDAIAALGPTVRFAVDDAGSGFASFRHILELEPDFVKLDIGLIHGIDRDPARQAFVAAMVYFTVRTGCTLIAEGIETEQERAMLQELGVDLAQGFLLGAPAPR